MSGYAVTNPSNPPEAPRVVLLARVPDEDRATWATNLTLSINAFNVQLGEAGSGWTLTPEPDEYTHPMVVPVELTYEANAAPAQKYPGPALLIDMLANQGLAIAADALLAGSPAYKPAALTRGDFGRVPVKVMAAGPPRRRTSAELAGVRRPVVALLDTTVQEHPWLGPPDRDLDGDGFWVDATSMNTGMNWKPGPWLDETGTPADDDGKLDRELEPQEGHGTFSAGLIRQVAPDARVLSVPVMLASGVVYGHLVLNALGWLRDQLIRDDVICLPVGFQPVWPMDNAYLTWLGDVLGDLRERGIKVVAASGNDGRDHPFYPAAFAKAVDPPDDLMVSVGALNPNGRTRAAFSNYGDWVTAWEVGTSVVSMFPKVDGAGRSELVVGCEGEASDCRESADPDDFTGRFARWSGASFAAAIYAGTLAQQRVGAALDAVAMSTA
jgi:hypothetical protein